MAVVRTRRRCVLASSPLRRPLHTALVTPEPKLLPAARRPVGCWQFSGRIGTARERQWTLATHWSVALGLAHIGWCHRHRSDEADQRQQTAQAGCRVPVARAVGNGTAAGPRLVLACLLLLQQTVASSRHSALLMAPNGTASPRPFPSGVYVCPLAPCLLRAETVTIDAATARSSRPSRLAASRSTLMRSSARSSDSPVLAWASSCSAPTARVRLLHTFELSCAEEKLTSCAHSRTYDGRGALRRDQGSSRGSRPERLP